MSRFTVEHLDEVPGWPWGVVDAEGELTPSHHSHREGADEYAEYLNDEKEGDAQ